LEKMIEKLRIDQRMSGKPDKIGSEHRLLGDRAYDEAFPDRATCSCEHNVTNSQRILANCVSFDRALRDGRPLHLSILNIGDAKELWAAWLLCCRSRVSIL